MTGADDQSPGEQISKNCLATVGQVENVAANQKILCKVGSKCWLGKRPVVRGIVLNPVDLPTRMVRGEPYLVEKVRHPP
ncbi:50S ribosomal protein l2 chloroplastic [Phtheirospermum japonicum]|uniref:50S ribosomal protein l2 chloroplastic n=1 Tax=Phtheirospermum japonicum TaxID=374723 RepID=A0A830BAG6_9LAMI|nr:50S ribosomal protein l2 chloroplastic [Phtheirospermum japonicum]